MAARTLRSEIPLLALTLLLAASLAWAQAPAQAPAARGRGRGVMLLIDQVSLALEGLNLTFDQQTKIEPILTAARADARGMAQDLAQADAPTRRGRARGLLLDLRSKIIPILNPDQARSFDQRLQDLRLGPANAPAAGQQPIGQVIEQLYDQVTRLELDDQQKPKIDTLFDQTRQKMLALRDNPPGDGSAPQKIAQTVQVLRDELMATLSATQREQLRMLIARADPMVDPAPAPQPRGRGRGRAGRAGRAMLPDAPMMQPDMMNPAAGGTSPAAARSTEPDLADLPGVPIGQPAPDFTLISTDNRPIALSSYKGKVTLLVFGSYTSPSFRQRAQALEQLRNTYSTRLTVLIIYTKENHPVGEWEIQRNKDEGIAIEQPKDLATRTAEAKKARTALRLTAPMLIDTMENSAATAFGGFSNAAILIGRDGNVLHRQKWFEPYALRRYIDEAAR